jgi:hypothetical protein
LFRILLLRSQALRNKNPTIDRKNRRPPEWRSSASIQQSPALHHLAFAALIGTVVALGSGGNNNFQPINPGGNDA